MKRDVKYSKVIIAVLILLPFFILSQKSKNPPEGILLNFNHFVGDKLLVLDDTNYVNELNQPYIVTKFNYYIGQIQLLKDNGKEYSIPNHFLISEDKIETKKIVLEKIPSGTYTSIRFILGVDSLHNCSGAQSGALDPINAMFWTWNTGYIFLKLEGKSTFSSAIGNTLEYHIGGYKMPNNSIRTITLPFENPIVIEKKRMTEINIKADISEILKAPTTIDFSTTPTVNTLLNAKIIADNYSDIFTIIGINGIKY